uniref:Pentatricopeptide repeat-containing protein n=1 Tax=Populus alba TaxID=43335 RepID=A0A4U5PZQ6_POPAL|nr:pentatricopeptide repeat-containing protein [Populus alba]
MLLFPPPLPNRFPSVYITSPIVHHHHHHHLIFQPPLSATSTITNFTDSSFSYSKRLHYASQNDIEGFSDDDVLPLQSRRYDFTPLLDYLSKKITTTTDSDSASSSPTSLDPTEFQLAESYRVVPGPLWHSLLKSLCISSSSIGLAYAVVLWLEKHNLCFSYELLYSILIHALGQSEKLYEAFLLSQRQNLTPLTYNALISACARNNDLEKALNLITRMRQDALYREIECDKLELDVQLSNDIIVGFAKAGDLSKALEFLGVVQGSGLSVKTATLVAVIWALGNCGRTVEAEAIFEEMRDNGLKTEDEGRYNALLRGYVKAGFVERRCEFVVSEMEREWCFAE